MDSNALMTRKRQKICCDLLALVDRGTKKTMSFLRVQPISLSVDYNAVSLPMQSFQWDSNNGS